jgi:hypothetical protein
MKLTGIELIYISNPFQTGLWNIIKGHEIVVPRNPVYRPHSDLVESGEEVFGDVNGRL